MSETSQNPFNTLLEIESRCMKFAAGLPQQIELRKPWSGIGFKIGDFQLVSAVGDVNEILHYPAVTTIPGTKNWVKGMANIRGNLIPIIDLNGYLGKEQTSLNASSRVLIINNDELWAGLLVDQVIGLKHFYDADVSAGDPKVDDNVDPYLSSGYQQNNDNWYVFSMETLAKNPGFFQVSL